MFKKEFYNLEMERSWKQAVGFYLALTLIMLLIAASIGGILGGIGVLGSTVDEIQQNGMKIGQLFSCIFTAGLCIAIISKKI